jgi:hypothetical protein
MAQSAASALRTQMLTVCTSWGIVCWSAAASPSTHELHDQQICDSARTTASVIELCLANGYAARMKISHRDLAQSLGLYCVEALPARIIARLRK